MAKIFTFIIGLILGIFSNVLFEQKDDHELDEALELNSEIAGKYEKTEKELLSEIAKLSQNCAPVPRETVSPDYSERAPSFYEADSEIDPNMDYDNSGYYDSSPNPASLDFTIESTDVPKSERINYIETDYGTMEEEGIADD